MKYVHVRQNAELLSEHSGETNEKSGLTSVFYINLEFLYYRQGEITCPPRPSQINAEMFFSVAFSEENLSHSRGPAVP